MRPPIAIAWDLRSRETSAITRCVVEEEHSGFVVRVLHGGREVSAWWHASREAAVTRTHSIKKLLLATDVFVDADLPSGSPAGVPRADVTHRE